MKSISHSQFTAYNECNLKWKLRYIDKLSLSGGNIHTLFGSAMHTVLQEYLTTMYNKSIVEAERLKLDVMLKEQMIKEFNIIRARWKIIPCEQKDMVEFYQDGVEIIKHFHKHRNKYFMKKNYELIGVEVPIFMNIQEGVQLKSFLDVVIRNKISGQITIIDLKTATRGWWDIQKKNFYKNYLKIGISGIVGGTGLGIAMMAFIWSIINTTAAITLLCLAAMPFITAILGFIFLKEKISMNVWLAILIATVGIIIMSIGGSDKTSLFGLFCFF